jgi:Mg/Co/Ni transporter MgtE
VVCKKPVPGERPGGSPHGASAVARSRLGVGTVIALNTLVAAYLGSIVPLALRRLDLEPAVAATPVLMAFNAMCGLFSRLASPACCCAN